MKQGGGICILGKPYWKYTTASGVNRIWLDFVILIEELV